MTWSFSRLNFTCLYEFKLHYIECNPDTTSFFAQFGTLCHKILEMYAKGELEIYELSQYYEEHFMDEVSMDAPYNKYSDIKQSYYDKGLEYFNNIDLELEKYEILGVEKEVKFNIDGIECVGYIDLLLKDKETGEITILDHKSASIKLLKNGGISKKDQGHFEEFKKQLYMYSLPIIEEYGRVDYLKWNLFKDQNSIKIPWNKKEFDETMKWVQDTVKQLKEERRWKPKPDFYYCHNICGQRFNCERRNEYE